MIKAILLIFILLTPSCLDNVLIKEINSYPEWNDSLKPNEDELYLFLVADIGRNLFPKSEQKDSTSPKPMPATWNIGGISILSSYLDTIKRRFPKRSLLFATLNIDKERFDPLKAKYLTQIIPLLPIDSFLMGINELMNPPAIAPDQGLFPELPWVNSNILNIKSGESTLQWGNLPYKTFESGPHKIGVIGVSSYKLVSENEKTKIIGHYFQDPVTSILRTKNQLKKEGVSHIFLFYQSPRSCEGSIPQQGSSIAKFQARAKLCNKDYELNSILEKLPPGTIDLVLAPQSGMSHHLIKDIPVLGTSREDTFIQALKLSLNGEGINFKESIFLPPIKLCHIMLAGTSDCYHSLGSSEIDDKRFEYLEKSAYGLIPARFLGQDILPNPSVEKILSIKN